MGDYDTTAFFFLRDFILSLLGEGIGMVWIGWIPFHFDTGRDIERRVR